MIRSWISRFETYFFPSSDWMMTIQVDNILYQCQCRKHIILTHRNTSYSQLLFHERIYDCHRLWSARDFREETTWGGTMIVMKFMYVQGWDSIIFIIEILNNKNHFSPMHWIGNIRFQLGIFYRALLFSQWSICPLEIQNHLNLL